ncbi:endoribonuclease Dicer homolog 2 [Pyrus x bretschneideri]|uniref:endoribonuclease Dicer homolog 2 n=1 Tax=Pyrus x bretschneideri TaxID=225117 RepID=UPI0020302564|nr:endoribonuclease Dicer homolog 2 [Pyrus x bretschneideri]
MEKDGNKSADPLGVEEATQELGRDDEQPRYVPAELVKPPSSNDASVMYHCYLIKLKQNFDCDIPVSDIVLGTRNKLDWDTIANMNFDLKVQRGPLTVNFEYAGDVNLCSEQALACRRFQITIFRILVDQELKKLEEVLERFHLGQNHETESIDYLLLPAARIHQRASIIDLDSVMSMSSHCNEDSENCVCVDCPQPNNNSHVPLHTKNGMVCTCRIQNSVVYTPHTDRLYCITGLLDDLTGNSLMRHNKSITYKDYYEAKHGINMRFDQQLLLNGRCIFRVQNYLLWSRQQRKRESSHASVELPPELCTIIMSPISISNLYSFSFVPSIMHRLESLLLAVNLKQMILDHLPQNVTIPTIKVLESITTQGCQENLDLESLETLGDSFLKYAASQQFFKTCQNDREGLLSEYKEKIISNLSLGKLGCDSKISGFIRNETFDPKKWIIPGEYCGSYFLKKKLLFDKRSIYVGGTRKIDAKTVADVVEALIGAFLSTGGELDAIYFMNWVGIKVDLDHIQYERHLQVQSEIPVDVGHLESLLGNYKFQDPSLLMEALSHGSYIPGGYQRLEFLGDAVLDYMITTYFYDKYPEMMAPGILTTLRSASVNNECYARSAVKAGLHKHILASDIVHSNIDRTVNNFGLLSTESTSGLKSETYFSDVLADIVEALAGAIYIDSGYNKKIVFQSIRPLLEPLVSPYEPSFWTRFQGVLPKKSIIKCRNLSSASKVVQLQ